MKKFTPSLLYNNEIPPGDFVTWEVTLNGEVASTGLLLQPYVTFPKMEKEKEKDYELYQVQEMGQELMQRWTMMRLKQHWMSHYHVC